MLAGGLGNIRREHIEKGDITVGALIVLGGPVEHWSGGGAASSMASGQSNEDLDLLQYSETTLKWSVAVRK